MTRTALRFVCASLFAAACVATVVMPEASASPEPEVADPMSGMQLYVVSAGAVTGDVKMLGASASVCPSDYPAGFSIECKSSFAAATFYVDGQGVRKEMTKPFYIAGDGDGFVRAWTRPAGKKSVTVACKFGGERVRSKISFVC